MLKTLPITGINEANEHTAGVGNLIYNRERVMAYGPRFDEAFVFASEVHRQDTRKGSSIPYITHLMAVASIVGTFGGTEDQVIGALLHDAIEDCVETIPDIAEQIGAKFGPDVLAIVDACSDTVVFPKPDWKTRKETYLKHLAESSHDAPYLLVSLADKVHNAGSIVLDYRQIGDELWGRFNKAAGREGTLWYYQELSKIFLRLLPGALADELARLVEVMGRDN